MKTPMNKTAIAATVAVVVVAVGAGLWWKAHAASSKPAAADDTPTAQVKTAQPRMQSLTQTLSAVGEVVAGQTVGLSFARPGQVSRLAVVVGDHVAAGTLLATLTPDPATVQAWRQAVDAEAAAQREWNRQKELLASHLATQSQVDAAEKTWHDAKNALHALDEQGGQGVSELKAPFDGVVATVPVAQGDRVAAGAAILQLGRADTVRILVGIEPNRRAKVHPGAMVSIWPDGQESADATRVDLRVSEVQDAIDPKTQLVDAVAVVPRGLVGALSPGMKVPARVTLDSVSALAIAHDAVLSDEQGDYVFQVVGGKAHRVPVKRQLDAGGLVSVSGLKDTQAPVVVEGNYELQDGMAVKEAAQ